MAHLSTSLQCSIAMSEAISMISKILLRNAVLTADVLTEIRLRWRISIAFKVSAEWCIIRYITAKVCKGIIKSEQSGFRRVNDLTVNLDGSLFVQHSSDEKISFSKHQVLISCSQITCAEESDRSRIIPWILSRDIRTDKSGPGIIGSSDD